MDDEIREVLLGMLSVMKVQAAFLSDALIRVEALRLHMANQGSLDYSEYTALSEQAKEHGDATMPRGQIEEIDEMMQRVSGMSRGYIQ
jgi:hypothetical protein